eukprot:Nk52_evm12s255 gene=Nk52_evmTU12s255
MHPSLDLHLHSEKCQEVIKKLEECHNATVYNKFVGACNDLSIAVDKCLYREYRRDRKANMAKARSRKKALKEAEQKKEELLAKAAEEFQQQAQKDSKPDASSKGKEQ